MLTTDELRTLIAAGESDRVEFTVSTTNTDKFGEAICAFANEDALRRNGNPEAEFVFEPFHVLVTIRRAP